MKKLKYTLLMSAIALGLSTSAFAEGYQQRSDMQSGSSVSTIEPAAGASDMKKLDSIQVRDLQQTLDTRGFSPGPIDGILGPQTRSAIREFQQANGLPVTGNPTSDTLAQLGVDAQGQRSRQQQQQQAPSQMETQGGMGSSY